MTGLITLQQGPLGVAASARKPQRAPSVRDITPTTDTPHSSLGNPAQSGQLPPGTSRQKDQQSQRNIQTVASATLFEASRLATPSPYYDAPAANGPASQSQSWLPPSSSLALRDRTV